MRFVSLTPSVLGCAIRAFALVALALAIFLTASSAQTPQPVLFAVSTSNNQYSASTFLRDDIAGSLTLLNTSAPFKNPCVPQAIDAKARFLFGICGDGLSLYTFDSASGAITEVPASPFSASVGNSGNLIVAESTGQYVYLLKVNYSGGTSSQSVFLDTFQIDAATPALIPLSTQTLPVAGTWVASAGDPNQHGLAILLNQNITAAQYSTAILYAVTFNPATGLATLDPTGGQSIGSNARAMSISPTGNYLSLGYGELNGAVTVYQIASANFALTNPQVYDLGLEGSLSFPDSIFFNPDGELLYVQAPPTNFTSGGLPFLIFDTSTFLQLPSSPLPLSEATFVPYLKDSQGPFAYGANTANGINGISVYLIDPGTGLATQNGSIASPFYPQLNVTPVLAPFGPNGGQGIGGPALTPSVETLTFPATVIAQKSGAQVITLLSSGQESVSLSSISITGANAADFLESDTCLTSPVLKPNATCAISIVYAPSAVATSQAALSITDNAPGSPQQIILTGTALAAPPPAPAISLNPAAALNFPGTVTQGTSSLAQSVTVTNSGNAPLQISNAVLTGQNVADFSIVSNTCASSLAVNATCSLSVVFTPQAAGLRSTTLLLTDNAANSPQSLAVSGTGTTDPPPSAPTISGTTTASVSAGQPAQFNLVASSSPNFTGTLTFTCTGVPFVATCTTPASVAISNGSSASFTVTISTTSAAATPPGAPVPVSPTSRPFQAYPWLFAALLFLFWIFQQRLRYFAKQPAFHSRELIPVITALLLAAILASGIACGGAGSTATKLPQVTAPSGTPAATPSLQPSGGSISTGFPMVSISDATPNSTIYYTTDGSAPTANSSTYSAAFPVNTPLTVQAIAIAPNYIASSVASATYKFQTPSGTFTILLTPTAQSQGAAKSTQLAAIPLALTVK